MSSFSLKGYDFIPLFKDPVCIAMHEDHPFTKYDKVPISALNGCDFIMPLKGWDDLVNIIIEKQSFTPNIRHYVASEFYRTMGICTRSLKYVSPALKEFINAAQQIVSKELLNQPLLKPIEE